VTGDQNIGAEGIGASGTGEYKEPKKVEEAEEKVIFSKDKEAKEEDATGIGNPGMETDGGEAVEYTAGVSKNPMEALALEAEEDHGTVPALQKNEGDNTKSEPDNLDDLVKEKEMAEPDTSERDVEKSVEKTIPKETPEAKFVENPSVIESDKPGFDPGTKQDARYNSAVEGGISRPRTTGPNKTNGGSISEGMQIKSTKPPADVSNKFSMSGFTVSFEETPGQGLISLEITDYFNDLETAQASINGDKYLMPLSNGGFKIVQISSGAPKISYQDRELYQYLNDKNMWSRV